MRREDLNGALADFRRLEDVRELPQDDRLRIREQARLISQFYDLVTTFYEFGWGPSFHFSPRRPRERLRASQRRHHEEIVHNRAYSPVWWRTKKNALFCALVCSGRTP